MSFLKSRFAGKTFFKYTLFEQLHKVEFDISNLSKISFADSDITRIKFGDKIRWGGKDRFTIIEEEWLKNKVKGQTIIEYENVSLGLVLSVYTNLRENYEFRLRYDDAGMFFIKEMELKRKYRHVSRYELRLITLNRKIKRNKSPQPKIRELIENGWLRRNLLSLTALYHLLSNYGESVTIAAIFGGITLLLPALIWIVQGKGERQNAFERSLTDFLPFLPFRGGIEIEIGDYLVKIAGALTFGLLIIALRRKFERKTLGRYNSYALTRSCTNQVLCCFTLL